MRVLITGGAGFIGCNLADALSQAGDKVIVLDNLSRPGSEINLRWLQTNHPDLRFVQANIQNEPAVRTAIREAGQLDAVIHLAAQVAVTTSVLHPRLDFEINAQGTLNVLEAVRAAKGKPVVIFGSTNKVYGELSHLAVDEEPNRYVFRDRPFGIGEDEPLSFHSPYGCSKGAADQYMLDYARIYGLRTVVFRQSCIYGRRQFGLEDQGWVAWFLRAALSDRPITIYGDGRQVRDVLFMDDLVRAYRAAIRTPAAWGQAFNIGGGPKFTMSVWAEFGPRLERLLGRSIPISYSAWRTGDQHIYVSDIRKAKRLLSWEPTTPPDQGIAELYEWTLESVREWRRRTRQGQLSLTALPQHPPAIPGAPQPLRVDG